MLKDLKFKKTQIGLNKYKVLVSKAYGADWSFLNQSYRIIHY